MKSLREKQKGRAFWAALRQGFLLSGAALLALSCFLVLPLLNTLGTKPDEELEVRNVGTVEEPPPPPPEIQEEEQKEEEPEPELADTPEPLDLSQLEMALDGGGGGDWGGDFAIDLGKYMKGAAGGEGILSMSDLDQKPRPLYQPSPTYPPQLQKQQIGGTVVLVFVVEPDGRVGKAKVKSSPNPILAREALTAIGNWKFEPGRRGGKAVAFRMRVPITFAPN